VHANVFSLHMAIIFHKCNSSLHYHMLMAISHIKSFGPLSLSFNTDGFRRYFCPFLSWKPLFAFKRVANTRLWCEGSSGGKIKLGQSERMSHWWRVSLQNCRSDRDKRDRCSSAHHLRVWMIVPSSQLDMTAWGRKKKVAWKTSD